MATRWLKRQGGKARGFRYLADNGREVRDSRVLGRIAALRVPPGWRDVHIAVNPRAAVQAWGYDVAGRKQYRYHARAVELGSSRKYYRVRQLALDLPAVRNALQHDLRAPAYSRRRALAGAVSLLSEGFFRVGSERHLEAHRTFGLTTLLKKHVTVSGDMVTFRYRGKRGVQQRQVIVNRSLSRFVRSQLRTPGPRLLRYRDGSTWRDVTAPLVNEYVREIAGHSYSSKDFRTWGGTLRAATVLAELGPPISERDAKKQVTLALRLVAAELGNTPAICRSSYVHPMVLARYVDGGEVMRLVSSRHGGGHAPEERALIRFLAKHFPERRRRTARPRHTSERRYDLIAA